MKSILLSLFGVFFSVLTYAQCNDLFISEYVHAYGNDRALEIYNPTSTPKNLADYRVVRYSNGGTTPNYVNLSNVLAPAECWVIVSDKRDPNGTGLDTMVSLELQAKADTFISPVYSVNKMMYFNGNDAVTLELSNGTYVDIIGKVGQDPGVAWTADTLNGFTSSGGARWWTRRQTLIRKASVQSGITANPPFFNPAAEWDSLGVKQFQYLGWHSCVCQPNGLNTPVQKVNDCFFYPNPSSNGFFLVKGTEIIDRVEVMTLTGQVVISEINPLERGDLRIETHNLQAGTYIVNVHFNDNSMVAKQVIIR